MLLERKMVSNWNEQAMLPSPSTEFRSAGGPGNHMIVSLSETFFSEGTVTANIAIPRIESLKVT